MTETQRRIRAYKRALPHMKERVIAVALLLAMSVSMMSSATFAWITLSASPEVSSLATTIVANGNLEIALSDTDGKEPDESAVGDGGQNVALSNLTWGNLINLSDESYGLDHLVLRPATRNDTDLLNAPVNAVTYGADGRVVDYTTDFAYSNYDKSSGAFLVPTTVTKDENGEDKVVNATQYGVRAVSSVTYEDLEGNAFLVATLDQINLDLKNARGLFQSIYQSDSYMNTVGSLVGTHVGYILSDDGAGNNVDAVVQKNEMQNLVKISDVFYRAMQTAGKAIVGLINLYQYLDLTDETMNTYHEYKFDEVFNINYSGEGEFSSSNLNNTLLNKYTDQISAIETYRTAWVDTVKFYNGIAEASAKSQVYWGADLMSHVNLLVNMDSAKLDGATASQMASDPTTYAMGIISGGRHTAEICGGALKDADQLLDGNMLVSAGRVTISVTVPQNIKDKLGSLSSLVPDKLSLAPDIITTATPPAELDTDYQKANKRASGGSNLKGVATAADTYAMAIDFWIRTNTKDSLLILEGELEKEERVLTDADGNPILDDNGNPRTTTVVTGYSGVNRVWDELDDPYSDAGALIYQSGGVSTTQGSGSCYVFYADSPEQQSQSLNMLRAMRVAFVDDKGTLLNVATMDVSNAVEDGGRVIVPLQLNALREITMADGTVLTDENGEPITQYIQTMPQNQPQRITALIYLDGELLSNSEVLEAGTIKGQLNIQFGTTDMDMEPQKDADLMKEFRTIRFEQTLYELGAYDPDNATIELKMYLEGAQPNTVKANFLSIINQSQGAKQETFTMKRSQDGAWIANVSFSGPGNYELRSVQLDGVDIALTPANNETNDPGNVVRVEIDGIAIQNLNCAGNWPSGSKTHQVRTADTYYQQPITLSIASDEFHTVRGIFIGDNGQNVSVNFAYQDGLYQGMAVFNSSSTYRMTYLEVDGMVSPLPESMYKTITLQLGLKAYITIGTPGLSSGQVNDKVLKNVVYDAKTGWSFTYTCDEPLNMNANVVIVDDGNKMLTDLSGLELWYGSSSERIDTELKPDGNGYAGEFVDFEYSGVFQFLYIKLDATNYITAAASAPTITSVPPDAVEYVEQAAYEPLVYEWGAERNLYVKLKNASAADLYVTLTSGAGVEECFSTRPTEDYPGVVQRGTPDEDGYITFTIQAPSDGEWKITGLELSTVFAKTEEEPDGKFFSGAELFEDGEKVGYDRLDLSEEVIADQIGSYFLTEITIQSEAAPLANYSGNFMDNHEANDMTISVTNQGRPLEKVLADVAAKFSTDENPIDPSVVVGMTYTWNEASKNYGISGTDANLPDHEFGSETLQSDGYTYSVGDMNFKLAGQYLVDFTLTIGGKEYTGAITDPNLSRAYITVTWNTPDVKITDYYPVGQCTTSQSKNSKGTPSISADRYSATVYTNCTWKSYLWGALTVVSDVVMPTVELTLTGVGSNFDGATLDVGDVTYEFARDSLVITNEIGSKWGASYAGYGYYNISANGDQKVSTIVMSYNDVKYTVNLNHLLQINNPA